MGTSDLFKGVEGDITKKICQFYERSEESLQEDVSTLRNWMKTQPHLPEILEDKSIQNFLFLNKCSIERTKQKIDMYYTLRSRIPDIYSHTNPKNPNIQRALKIGCWVTFPKLTKEMYRVNCFKIFNKDLAEMLDLVDIIALGLDLYEIRLKEDTTFGDVVIFDCESVGLQFVTKLTPSILSKALTISEKVYSAPLKKMYLVNCTKFLDTVLTILKKVMKPKLFERVVVLEDASNLKEHLLEEILPKDYGGQEKSLEELNDLVKDAFVKYQGRFDQLDKLKVDESLRPEPLKNDEVLGFHGNFKALDVD